MRYSSRNGHILSIKRNFLSYEILGIIQSIHKKFKDHGWLLFDDKKTPNIRFSSRLIAEIKPYLKTVYEDFIDNCQRCGKLVIQVSD